MKRFIGILAVLVLLAGAGTALGSDRARHGGGEAEETGHHSGKVYGTIRKMPEGPVGIWQVNGREISVTGDTRIREKHGKAEVGAYVEIKGILSGRMLVAREIEVKRARP